MAGNKVMKLWTAIVTAFLALCAALGFATTTAEAAVAPTQPEGGSAPQMTLPGPAPDSWARDRSLPPTMKQRIHAEAHGASPTCRHRARTTAVASTPLARHALRSLHEPATSIEPTVRLRL
ncbi:DUF6344 domain-containing protein [Streptomyces sp. NPDC007264]|uniref:DUF6344 domain-containing protein n=1 Tax=Streptomyces sp. NPDC007264 TaxID=3364777 RepID=UPI0036DED379